ncbi:hypothetical protein RINTHH_790 [Richelia intracellularis HH01]|uniref:Uncharacterized protein n=1 Tax=Richelia intracellularis HH01 TaxID=1165094 RepID=M1WQ94_9NOST|nr:hypothetical protein RINTHH_790 [Richelia intracellularis HH01]HAE05990.1 hypothetical protein [Richelia sp.]
MAYSIILAFSQLFLFLTSSNLAVGIAARLDDWHFSPDRLQLKLNLLGDTQPRHFSLKKTK